MTAAWGPTLVPDAVLAAALQVTGARSGWLMAAHDELVVVAARFDGAQASSGAHGPLASGWAGSVIAQRRPVALIPDATDARFTDDVVLTAEPRPQSLLCFPCPFGDRIVGALQLVDKAGGGLFSVDDVELVAMLAEIAGAALAEAELQVTEPPPSPQQLGTQLQVMAARNPGRYASVAEVVAQLLLRS